MHLENRDYIELTHAEARVGEYAVINNTPYLIIETHPASIIIKADYEKIELLRDSIIIQGFRHYMLDKTALKWIDADKWKELATGIAPEVAEAYLTNTYGNPPLIREYVEEGPYIYGITQETEILYWSTEDAYWSVIDFESLAHGDYWTTLPNPPTND